LRYAAELCAKQIVAEKTRLRDEELAAKEAAQAQADSASADLEGEPKPAA
jgi:hypothetical protein